MTNATAVPVPAVTLPAPPAAPGVREWLRAVPAAWTSPGLWTWMAVLMILGILGDAATTSMVGTLPGLMEGNPVARAGQEAFGSVPAYMVAVSIPVAAVVAVVPARPVSPNAQTLWMAAVALGAVKVAVATWNTGLLVGLGLWLPGLLD